jgi:hypothetical protein
MLRQAFQTKNSSVNVYRSGRSAECKVAIDFALENLWIVLLDNGLWAVECLEFGHFLIFDDTELVKIEH